jgi:hypothetical protein
MLLVLPRLVYAPRSGHPTRSGPVPQDSLYAIGVP